MSARRKVSGAVVILVASAFALGDLPTARGRAEPKPVVLKGHAKSVVALAWRPDGKVLASGGGQDDGTMRLWDATTGKEIAKPAPHSRGAGLLAWRPDGKVLMTGSQDGKVRVFPAVGGKETSSLNGQEGFLPIAQWKPDGKAVAVEGDWGVRVWDPVTGKAAPTLKADDVKEFSPSSLAWRPDGKVLAAGMPKGDVKFWDPTTRKITATLEGHTNRAGWVSWRPDGKALASGGDTTVRVWDPTGKQTAVFNAGGDISKVAWRPDGKALALALVTSKEGTGQVVIWDPVDDKTITTLENRNGSIGLLAWRPDGKALATVQIGGRDAQVWDTETGKVTASLRGDDFFLYAIGWRPDSKVLATGGSEGIIRLWTMDPGK